MEGRRAGPRAGAWRAAEPAGPDLGLALRVWNPRALAKEEVGELANWATCGPPLLALGVLCCKMRKTARTKDW